MIRRRWEITALLGILVTAALLYAWAPGSRVVQPYYAAAVHSMSQSTRHTADSAAATGCLLRHAWAVLPALALAYLPAPVSRRRKLGQLALAGSVTFAMSLWWPLLASLWPGDKPFVGNTSNGSIWQLILGYNGFGRLVGADSGSLSALGAAVGTNLGGAPGPLRLFDSAVGGQIAWFLPLAIGSVLVAAFRYPNGTPKQRSGWLMWGGWLAVYTIVFSFTGGIFHAYYTATLAPAVAALSAAGLVSARRGTIALAFVHRPYGEEQTLLTFEARATTTDQVAYRWADWHGHTIKPTARPVVRRVLRRVTS